MRNIKKTVTALALLVAVLIPVLSMSACGIIKEEGYRYDLADLSAFFDSTDPLFSADALGALPLSLETKLTEERVLSEVRKNLLSISDFYKRENAPVDSTRPFGDIVELYYEVYQVGANGLDWEGDKLLISNTDYVADHPGGDFITGSGRDHATVARLGSNEFNRLIEWWILNHWGDGTTRVERILDEGTVVPAGYTYVLDVRAWYVAEASDGSCAVHDYVNLSNYHYQPTVTDPVPGDDTDLSYYLGADTVLNAATAYDKTVSLADSRLVDAVNAAASSLTKIGEKVEGTMEAGIDTTSDVYSTTYTVTLKAAFLAEQRVFEIDLSDPSLVDEEGNKLFFEYKNDQSLSGYYAPVVNQITAFVAPEALLDVTAYRPDFLLKPKTNPPAAFFTADIYNSLYVQDDLVFKLDLGSTGITGIVVTPSGGTVNRMENGKLQLRLTLESVLSLDRLTVTELTRDNADFVPPAGGDDHAYAKAYLDYVAATMMAAAIEEEKTKDSYLTDLRAALWDEIKQRYATAEYIPTLPEEECNRLLDAFLAEQQEIYKEQNATVYSSVWEYILKAVYGYEDAGMLSAAEQESKAREYAMAEAEASVREKILLYSLAKRFGVSVTDREIRDYKTETYESYRATYEAYYKAYSSSGMSDEQIKKTSIKMAKSAVNEIDGSLFRAGATFDALMNHLLPTAEQYAGTITWLYADGTVPFVNIDSINPEK